MTPAPRRLAVAVAAAGAVAAGAALSARRLADFDLPWHLAFGRLVVAHRGLVRVDELAYTARPIRLAEYVSDVGLYLALRAFGPLGLQLAGGLLAIAVAVLLFRASARGGDFAFAVVAVAMAAIHPWLLVRPATASFALLALVLVVLGEVRAGVRDARALYALVPLSALWANVHGFVELGLLLLAGDAAYAALCRVARGRLGELAPEAHGRDAGTHAIAALLCLLASCVNQAGPALLLAPFAAASSDFGRISEWDTTTLAFLAREAPLAALLAVGALVALAWGREPDEDGARRTPTLFDLGLVALALVLGRTAVRMVPVAVVFVVPVVARRLGARLAGVRAVEGTSPFVTWLVAPFILATSPAPLGVGFDPAHFSEGAIRFVLAERPSGHVYDSVPLGGWLEWRLFPLYQVLVDGRRTGLVHDPELVATYHTSETDPHAFAELSRRFDFEWAFVFAAEGSPFGTTIARSPDWAMVYWDDAAAIYVKTDGPNAALARRGYRLLRHQTGPGDVFRSSLARDPTALTLARDAHLAAAQAPSSPRAAFLEGCAALAESNRPALDAAIAKLRALSPNHPGATLLARGWTTAITP